jgi:exopolysaccharide biosynthesis polyprenyl glycosylphosphotransferase
LFAMANLRRKFLLDLLKMLDLLIMGLAFSLGLIAEQYNVGSMDLNNFLSMRVKIENLIVFCVFLISWHVVFSSFLLYQSRRFINRWVEVLDCLKATFVGCAVIIAWTVLFHRHLITPFFVPVFFASSSALTISNRLILRFIVDLARRRGRNNRSMLIVGTNTRAVGFAKDIEQNPYLGYRILGFVDNEWPGMERFQQSNYPLKGNFNDVPAILRDQIVDEVVISLPVQSLYEQASRIVSLCLEQGITVRFLAAIFPSQLFQERSDVFGDNDITTIYPGAIIGWPALAKRCMDFALSVVLIIVFSPLFLITALLIKITSPGPILFIQDRVGLNKRIFRLYKFRTMVINAEKLIKDLEHLNEVKGAAFKIKNDPRITRVGRIVRKLSLDELPQLFNVLKGDMSLVGPRPLPIRDYNGFSQDWQRRRFSVMPGLTCLWQISGRSCITFDRWMELDMEYIDRWSLWLDLKILFKTIPAVMRGEGAT